MKRAIVIFFLAASLFAQQKPTTTQNPLDKLHDQAKAVFERAGVPFSEEQEKSIALMIEDRRQASEDLFGQLMDFRSGPVQGQQQDQAVAAIKWMHDEFKKRLSEYLTEEQRPIWDMYEAGEGIRALEDLIKELTGGSAPKQQTQFIRIINNSFTAENGYYSGQSVNTDVIQRAGIGAFHGNAAFQFKDESLNARNPFAHNRPPYQERQTNFNFNGPVIRNRMTINVNGSHNLRESANTVHAITPAGPYDLGITNPSIDRFLGVNGTYQISEVHSFNIGTNTGTNIWKNQGVGGFNLPERASDGQSNWHNIYVNETAVLSDKTLYRTSLSFWHGHDEQTPRTNAVTIDVLGAFGAGGSPGRSEGDRSNFYVSNLFSHAGQKVTVKAGFESGYRKLRTLSEDNFLGSFTFSDLDAYGAGIATTYRVTRGNPLLTHHQYEMSLFEENDIKFTQRLTAMFGLRYDYQSNLADHNNAAPRVGFAYAVGRSTVIRGGVGIYYDRLYDWIVETVKRADGTHQYDLVIDHASYPDPFQSGTATINPPASIRILDQNLVAPYNVISAVSVERTFKNNLFLSGRYEFRRGVHQFRTRDANAPLPGQSTRPDPSQGNVLNLESTALSRSQVLSFTFRQRFSIFNVNGTYSHYSQYNDSDWFFGTPSDNYQLRADWGRSGTPVHQFNTTVNAKLFMGVFLTGAMTANSGNFYNITVGSDCNGDSNIVDRPTGPAFTQYMKDLSAYRKDSTASPIQDGSAYCGIAGKVIPRNTGLASGFLNFNFNISKAFFIGGNAGGAGNSRMNMNLFANMTNAFNRTNRGTPSGIMTSPQSFGQPYSARNAREIEVGLRFQF